MATAQGVYADQKELGLRSDPAAKLGIVAGSGDLPSRIIKSCQRKGRDMFVLAFENETARETVDGVTHEWVRLGAISQSIKILKDNGVKELVLAGKISRPTLSSLRPDLGAARLLARIGATKLSGDNTILTIIVSYLEEQGFKVVGVDDILTDVISPKGVIGNVEPDEVALADIQMGIRIARAIGDLDIGQAVVIQMGRVLAVEAAEGTDAMIRRCPEISLEGPKGVLVKVKKPKQETRVDLPTIGVNTVVNCHAAGLRGIAVEAGGSIIIDRDEVAQVADKLGLFVMGID